MCSCLCRVGRLGGADDTPVKFHDLDKTVNQPGLVANQPGLVDPAVNFEKTERRTTIKIAPTADEILDTYSAEEYDRKIIQYITPVSDEEAKTLGPLMQRRRQREKQRQRRLRKARRRSWWW